MTDIITINGVECYEKDGVAYLRLETVARGLGFTEIAASGNECVKWSRVRRYLEEIGFPSKLGKGVDTCVDDGYIPENIFYRLAMKAKNETAERFQAKIADEVLPSLRKHGAYMTPETLEQVLLTPDTIIKIATALKDEQEKRKALEAQAEADKPLVMYAKTAEASGESVLIGVLAKRIKQGGVEMGQNRLFEWLRNKGYLISRRGEDYNMPTQKSMEMGLFEVKEMLITHSDGRVSVRRTPKVTMKGQQYFVNKFMGAGD